MTTQCNQHRCRSCQRSFQPLIVILTCVRLPFGTCMSLFTSNDTTRTSLAQALVDRVRNNNRASDAATVPFLVGDKHLGDVLPQAVHALSQYSSVFSLTDKGLRLVDCSNDIEQRSEIVNQVLLDLRRKNLVPALAGWRDEPFAVRESFNASPELIIERAAAVLFGVPAYGVFLNGYTIEESVEQGQELLGTDAAKPLNTRKLQRCRPTHLWIGRRSPTKATWPGRLDSLAAGGLAAGMLPMQAMLKECQEEAGINKLLPQAVSAVSYTSFNEDGWGLKRDVLFCFDLELPSDFTPLPVDGEMESFEKIPVEKVLELLAMSVLPDDSNNAWKPNVAVVLIDFCVRHGFVDVNDPMFLQLVGALRGATCA